MTDKEFINEYKKITITSICNETGVNYHNIMCGRAGYEATKKVAKAIADKICDLLNKRNEFVAIDFDLEKEKKK